ncbi:MAG: von willebrand factor type, partial [Chthonomonadales bacterium]|nr:von willebrand factor type [Chthonomonadales bacterium]
SGLFDTSGRITGVLGASFACDLGYFPTSAIFADIANPPGAPALTRDVMIVFDRSGSMSLPAGTGRTKMAEAREAASLFVQLIQGGTGNHLGLVSFSTTASIPVDFALAPVTAAEKTALIGPSPFTSGIVGALAPGGSTTIGGGLAAAAAQFTGSTGNPRTILLLTDGLENTPPMIADEHAGLNGVAVEIIGFGTEASLDGALLTTLAGSHGGLYHRAGDPLALRKFFALAFGNIFESGTLLDPNFTLPAGQRLSDPVSFNVCGEERLTVVAGWDVEGPELALRLTTPGGVLINASTPGVESSTGRTWTFLRIPLPHGGERDGAWTAEVVRGVGRDERAPLPALTYFVSIIATGGPRLTRFAPTQHAFTGETINPLVIMRYPTGGFPANAMVHLTVTKPTSSIGTILSQAKLGAAKKIDADTIPAPQATLLALEEASGLPIVNYVEESFELFDDARHNNGSLEKSGIFGNPLTNLLTVEGHYTFHARALYGTGCVSTRELVWTQQVSIKIDPTHTTSTTIVNSTDPDGIAQGTITLVPRDAYGNNLGPGRSDRFTPTGGPSTTVTGPVEDNGDGSYTIPLTWNPFVGPPLIVLTQPDLPLIVISGEPPPPPGSGTSTTPSVSTWCLPILWIVIVFLILRLLFFHR